jgi:hypothetical protein
MTSVADGPKDSGFDAPQGSNQACKGEKIDSGDAAWECAVPLAVARAIKRRIVRLSGAELGRPSSASEPPTP